MKFGGPFNVKNGEVLLDTRGGEGLLVVRVRTTFLDL